MFVDFELGQQTAGGIAGIRQVGGAMLASLLPPACRRATAVPGACCCRPPPPLATCNNDAHMYCPPPRCTAPQYITNEHLHCGIREAGGPILEKLLNLARGGTLLR